MTEDEDDIEVIDEEGKAAGEEETASGAAPARKTTKGKMDAAKWAECVMLAEVEGIRGSELAKRYDVSPSLISRHFTENNIVVGSKMKATADKAVDEAQERIAKMVADFAVARKRRIQETKIQHYQWAGQIGVEAMNLIKKAKEEKKPFAVFDKDMKMLKQAVAIIAEVRSERFITLDAENEIDETSLPPIRFLDLSDEDIDAIQKAQLDGDPTEDGERAEVVETE